MAVGVLERTAKPVGSPPTQEWTRTAPIRARYPNPASSANWRPGNGTYCVGGAFLAWLGDDDWHGFPGPEWLAHKLQEANPGLEDAEVVAYRIIARNDEGNFEAAWQALEQALAY